MSLEKERFAIIDLGTNTFHLLIAEKNGSETTILMNEKISVKIGQGGISKNFIQSDAYERALRTLTSFREIIDLHKVVSIHAIATSAIRNARNGYTLVKDIKDKTGIDIQVISGEKEAELIYNGVKFGTPLGKSTSVIMDIGGGSVEFIICNHDNIFWSGSFEIGAQRLVDKFHQHDPITKEDINNLFNYLQEKLIPVFEASEIYKPLTLIGSSGTFDTLCEIDVLMKGIEFSMEQEKEYTLSIQDFEKISFDIISKKKDERMLIPGMAEIRVDMIVVASVLIDFIIQKLQLQKIKISPFALKEGVLSKLLNGEML
jgi:exopolyphosphatase/guanosine-5'-triphosphate,3'-diphosphate pyrophosphatase